MYSIFEFDIKFSALVGGAERLRRHLFAVDFDTETAFQVRLAQNVSEKRVDHKMYFLKLLVTLQNYALKNIT